MMQVMSLTKCYDAINSFSSPAPLIFHKKSKGRPFARAIFAAIFLLLMHAIKWIDLRMYHTICGKAI